MKVEATVVFPVHVEIEVSDSSTPEEVKAAVIGQACMDFGELEPLVQSLTTHPEILTGQPPLPKFAS